MNNFELFKLKQAGLTNLNILAILEYQKQEKKSLSLRDMAVVSKCKNPILFMEKYKDLDSKTLRKVFNQYPSISILDDDYPLELNTLIIRLFCFFIKAILICSIVRK